jgi:hypothetical protein
MSTRRLVNREHKWNDHRRQMVAAEIEILRPASKNGLKFKSTSALPGVSDRLCRHLVAAGLFQNAQRRRRNDSRLSPRAPSAAGEWRIETHARIRRLIGASIIGPHDDSCIRLFQHREHRRPIELPAAFRHR